VKGAVERCGELREQCEGKGCELEKRDDEDSLIELDKLRLTHSQPISTPYED